MALQFVLGGSGSGKSNYIYQHIIEQSKLEPEQMFFVIVPEQFTLQTQRELVSRQENHGIMNIDVVSFQRLAYRVFDELGKTQIKVLEETGKNFVLRKVAIEKQEELRILKGNMKKTGYINEVKSVISELVQYRIDTQQLQELIADESQPAPFRYRMSDIQLMYQGFQDYLQGNYITAEEILQVLAQEAPNSRILKESVLVLDGFTGFTPIQYALLEKLMLCAKDVYVTVTLDEREDPYLCTGMQELFHMSKKTVETLSKIAKNNQLDIAEPIKLKHGALTRFCQAKELEWLEQNLFRHKVQRYREPVKEIALYSLANPRQELIFLAGEIKRLVREEGYRYQDMAIVCGDVEQYGNYVPEIFEAYEIPYFLDKKSTISFHPFTEMIKGALKVAEQDFSYEGILAYLRSGLSRIPREDIDLLENYLLANRIRGQKAWSQNWVRLSGAKDARELEKINDIRQELFSQFEPELDIWRSKETTVLQKTIALYEFVTARQVEQQLENRRMELEQQGRLALSKEYAQIYKLVMDLLNKLTQLLPEEQMGIREYREILEAGFEASNVGIIPPGYDQILVGDIQRTRLPEIKILFLAGVNDGLIPKQENQGGLISQQERELFARYDMELAPGPREKAFIQKFYLYLNLTKPSKGLYLTWNRTNGEGKEIRKSYLVGMIQKIFPALDIHEIEKLDELQRIVTPKSSQRYLIEGLQQARDQETTSVFLALLNWYRSQKDWSEKVENLLDAAFYTYQKQMISGEVTRQLYGSVLENSVSRLEKFASCAYAHFMAYGMGVKERELGEFAPVDMGSMFHEALECYSVKMEEAGYHWFDVPKEVQERLTQEAVTETVEKAGYILHLDARTAYTIQRISRILKKTIETIGIQIGESDFTPEGYEVSFSFAQNMESVDFSLSEEEKMRLKGRIDRMDIKKQGNQIYVKVVDYKSGNTQFQLVSLYHGLQLQLVVYLNAAVDILKKKYPEHQIVPAGMFYYHIDDPVIDVKGQESPEEIKKKILEELKLKGVGCQEQDASVSKKSQQVDASELRLLSDFVNTKIRSLGQEIFKGDIQAAPYALKERTGCDYCPYQGICGFDTKVPGYEYRKLPEWKEKKEIMEKMKKEIGDGNDIYQGTTTGH